MPERTPADPEPKPYGARKGPSGRSRTRSRRRPSARRRPTATYRESRTATADGHADQRPNPAPDHAHDSSFGVRRNTSPKASASRRGHTEEQDSGRLENRYRRPPEHTADRRPAVPPRRPRQRRTPQHARGNRRRPRERVRRNTEQAPGRTCDAAAAKRRRGVRNAASDEHVVNP